MVEKPAPHAKPELGLREFVVLMAMLMSIAAMSIDAMLPALRMIGESLGVGDPNDTQLVISTIFAGMGVGTLFFGPLSDSFGRRPAIVVGVAVYALGCLVSVLSGSFGVMLAGRALQGFGSASTRIVALAIIRDRFQGDAMARVMSFITIVFILVPAVAPSIGQLILLIAPWRAIFAVLLVLAVTALSWFWLRQAETLPGARRLPFSARAIFAGAAETYRDRAARGYMIASGCIFGALVAYVSTARQVFQDQYGVGSLFPLYFGAIALSVGASSFVNSRLVMVHGMRALCRRALLVLATWSAAWLGISLATGGTPPLAGLLAFFLVAFFSLGMLFGNFNALALESLGHIAGVASTVIGATQTLISSVLGALIGHAYNGTVTPLIAGFALLSLGSLASVLWTERRPAGA